jgi:hypothetical protein
MATFGTRINFHYSAREATSVATKSYAKRFEFGHVIFHFLCNCNMYHADRYLYNSVQEQAIWGRVGINLQWQGHLHVSYLLFFLLHPSGSGPMSDEHGLRSSSNKIPSLGLRPQAKNIC